MAGDYIIISRKITEWEWYTDLNTKVLFIHLLLKANWKPGRFMGVEVDRGSLATSYNNLSLETGLSVRNVRTALEHLQKTGEVTVNRQPKYSVITIKNYDKYQLTDKQLTQNRQATDTELTGNRQATDRQSTTIEKGNKGRREEQKEEEKGNKKDKENKNIVAPSAKDATFPEDSFEMLCVNTLVHSCLGQFPGAKVPTTAKEKQEWCVHIDRMKRLDRRSEADIELALKYAVTNQFWKTNIRSTKKFREKFETLFLQAQQQFGCKQERQPDYERAERMRRWAEGG